jgi:hypothetical protein
MKFHKMVWIESAALVIAIHLRPRAEPDGGDIDVTLAFCRLDMIWWLHEYSSKRRSRIHIIGMRNDTE